MIRLREGNAGAAPTLGHGVAGEPPALSVVVARWATALVVAALSGWAAASRVARPGARTSDFEAFYTGAQLVARGVNPYSSATWPLADGYFYPPMTAVATMPLLLLSLPLAAAVFSAVGGLLLTLGLTRDAADGPWPLVALASPGYLEVLNLGGGWPPLLIAGALVPGLAWTAMLKPNLGMALVAGWPRRSAILIGAAAAVAALALNPHWPAEWVAATARMPPHPPPARLPGGFLVLAALFRWRRPEARLLAVMACVPQTPYFADQLILLALIPRTALERAAVVALAWVGFLCAPTGDTVEATMRAFAPYVLWSVYLPALALVLRRPNEGACPPWLAAAWGAARRYATRQKLSTRLAAAVAALPPAPRDGGRALLGGERARVADELGEAIVAAVERQVARVARSVKRRRGGQTPRVARGGVAEEPPL